MPRRERSSGSGGPVAAGLLGLTKQQAVEQVLAAGLTVRMVDWDEVEGGVMLTMELRTDRVTVQVKDGVVVEAEVG